MPSGGDYEYTDAQLPRPSYPRGHHSPARGAADAIVYEHALARAGLHEIGRRHDAALGDQLVRFGNVAGPAGRLALSYRLGRSTLRAGQPLRERFVSLFEPSSARRTDTDLSLPSKCTERPN